MQNYTPTLSDIISQLSPPNKDWVDMFTSLHIANRDWYLQRYQEYFELDRLNQDRILSEHYSTEAERPFYEVIAQHCPQTQPLTEEDRKECRSNIAPLVARSLEKLEEDIKKNFNDFMSKSDDEQLSPFQRALHASRHVRSQIDPVQRDYHSSSEVAYTTPQGWQAFFQDPTYNDISDNLVASAWTVMAFSGYSMGY